MINVRNFAEEASCTLDIDLSKLPSIHSMAERLNLLYRAAAKLEYEDDRLDDAYQILEYALFENPLNHQTLERLERLAKRTGKWQQLCSSVTAALEMASGRQAHIFLCLKIGDWCAVQLDRPDYAATYYQRVLEISPNNLSALKRLGSLYRAAEQWEDLSSVLAASFESSTDKKERVEFLLETADILEKRIEDVELAVKCYEYVLDLDSQSEEAFEALYRIYNSDNKWCQLLVLLQRKVEATENEERKVTLHMQIAEIFWDRARDMESAVSEYQAILEIQPGYEPALKSLELLYHRLNMPRKVCEIIERQVEHAEDDNKKIALLERLGNKLTLDISLPDKAAYAWESILEIAPKHLYSIERLIDVYEQQRKWSELARVLQKKIQLVTDNGERCAALVHLGIVFEKELENIDEAANCYCLALGEDSENMSALEGMARIHQRNADWSPAREILMRIAVLTTSNQRKLEIYHSIGTITAEKMGNVRSAADYFMKALEVDKGHLPSLQSLRLGYTELKEWERVIEICKIEQELVETNTAKSRLIFEIGMAHQCLGRLDESKKYYTQAIAVDPYNRLASEAMIPFLLAENRYAEAEPVLAKFVRTCENRPKNEQFELNYCLAIVRQALGRERESLDPARAAYGLAKTRPDVLSVYGNALMANQQWRDARDIYKRFLEKGIKELSKVYLFQILFRLGCICSKLYFKDEAIDYLLEAKKLEPKHRGVIENLVDLYERDRQYENVVKYREKLVLIQKFEERIDNLMEIANICINKLNDPQAAIDAYLRVVMLRPDDRAVLHRLLSLYRKTNQWQKLRDTISRIAEQEKEPEKLARFYYTMGLICRDKLEQYDAAIECFDAALDANPNDDQAFIASVRLLTTLGDLKKLERCFRKMIFRVHDKCDQAKELELWYELGEIYRTRLMDFSSAAEAYQTILSANPRDMKTRELMAFCFLHIPERAEAAIAEYRNLINLDPENADYYRPLGNLLASQGRYDEAWCVSAALYLMGKANSQERAFYEQYAPIDTPVLNVGLNRHLMPNLRHPADRETIAEIFAIVIPAIISRTGKPRRAYGLHRSWAWKKKQGRLMRKIFHYAAECLDLRDTPKLYLREQDNSSLAYILTDPPASTCGEQYPQGRSQHELLFMVAKHLAYYRRGRPIRWFVPTLGELKSVLIAAIKTVHPDYLAPKGKTGLMHRYVETLRQMLKPEEIEALTFAVQDFLAEKESPRIKKWVEGVEYTACRAAMLLTGDLVRAAALLRTESGFSGELPVSKKIRDLKVFSISREYSSLRRSLGICIDE